MSQSPCPSLFAQPVPVLIRHSNSPPPHNLLLSAPLVPSHSLLSSSLSPPPPALSFFPPLGSLSQSTPPGLPYNALGWALVASAFESEFGVFLLRTGRAPAGCTESTGKADAQLSVPVFSPTLPGAARSSHNLIGLCWSMLSSSLGMARMHSLGKIRSCERLRYAQCVQHLASLY